jgi:hypothetical protein
MGHPDAKTRCNNVANEYRASSASALRKYCAAPSLSALSYAIAAHSDATGAINPAGQETKVLTTSQGMWPCFFRYENPKQNRALEYQINVQVLGL